LTAFAEIALTAARETSGGNSENWNVTAIINTQAKRRNPE
jgi:hypothetical protein